MALYTPQKSVFCLHYLKSSPVIYMPWFEYLWLGDHKEDFSLRGGGVMRIKWDNMQLLSTAPGTWSVT
jgi:hypothetical protein